MKSAKDAKRCRLNVDPSVVGAAIRDLRRCAHLSQGELASRLGMRQGPVCNLERGKNLPSAHVLLRLADVLRVSTDQILRPSHVLAETASKSVEACEPCGPPLDPVLGLEPVSPAARRAMSVDAVPVEIIVRDYLALEDICRALRQARIPLQLAFTVDPAGLTRMASQFRTLFGIGDAVVFDPLELFENYGLRVVFMPLTTVNHFAYYDAPNGNVFIFVRADLNPEKQIFGLAYELGRILLHTRAGLPSEAPIRSEAKADKAARHFAACFLMPEQAVRVSAAQTGVLPHEWDFEMLLRLKHRFGVSAEAFNYRLLELGLITDDCQDILRAEIKQHYDAHAFAEPGKSRRILSPNGRLGDLLYIALRRNDPEARVIAARLKRMKIVCER
ncbi:MAG: XRE family transcriptional regulator [Kiritimatiellia bacterium]|nr:XRE family transcriptional regulator [Kiritimatiellia bacterium]MDD4174511.1 XRE family transcriptional regulator [Kiritimatiellia bacterium]NLC79695.1 ImmA/IrrE family metallo-endopeptidase [Lentisphaerota bacterium]